MVGATDFASKPVRWLVICQRIRYMLRMNEALDDLRCSQARLAKAQRIARLGNWELDLGAGGFTASEELLRLYGLESCDEEATLDVILSRVHPDDRGLVRNALERSSEEASALSLDHRVNLPDGAVHTLHLQADPILDDLHLAKERKTGAH